MIQEIDKNGDGEVDYKFLFFFTFLLCQAFQLTSAVAPMPHSENSLSYCSKASISPRTP
jgi:hypothetical protein